jgi:hypothetical protein
MDMNFREAQPVTRVSQLRLMALTTESFRTQVAGQLEGSVETQERDGR